MSAVALTAGLLLLPAIIPPAAPLPDWIRISEAFRTIDQSSVSSLWDMPVPQPPAPPAGPDMQQLRAERAKILQTTNNPYLLDPSHSLDHFYTSLAKGRVVRILHFGDSPTTADLITADARNLLQREYGDAGAGFVLIARPWAWYNHRGLGMEAWNWSIDVAGQAQVKDGLYGLGGARFRGLPGSEAHWILKGGQHRSVEVASLSGPDGGTFELLADDVLIGTGDTWSAEAEPGFHTFEFPAGTTELKLRVTSGSVRLFGVEFRKNRAGLIYSSLGINGASVTVLSKAFSRQHLAAQLRHYQPDLVVLAYGTNESGYPKFVENSWAQEMKSAVERVRSAVPDASILLMSPMDRGFLAEDGSIQTIAALPRLVKLEASVAEQQKVAFFNTFEAMGGPGTMAEWYRAQPRLVGSDYIHPLPAGAKVVGELLFHALQDGRSEYKLRKERESLAGGNAALVQRLSR